MDENELDDDRLEGVSERAYSMSETNPYTGQLEELLTKYIDQETAATAEKKRIIDEATNRLLQRQSPDKYQEAAELFRISAAFAKPTRTGAFAESLGNVAETSADILTKRGARDKETEELLMKYKLAGLDTDTASQKAKINALSALARSAGSTERLTEVERLTRIIEDPASTATAKKAAQARLDKLTYIPPAKGAAGAPAGPQSPAGRMAADLGLTPGTSEFKEKVEEITKTGAGAKLSSAAEKELYEAEDKIAAGKEVVLAFEQALRLNNLAYEGPTAGAKEVAGRFIPIISGSEAQTATADLENVVLGTALTQLKAIFGAAPTEGERKILIDVQGSINKPLKTREAIWKRAQQAAARRIAVNQEKIKGIKSGAYSRMDTGEAPQEQRHGGKIRMEEGGAVEDDGLIDEVNLRLGLIIDRVKEGSLPPSALAPFMQGASEYELAEMFGRTDTSLQRSPEIRDLGLDVDRAERLKRMFDVLQKDRQESVEKREWFPDYAKRRRGPVRMKDGGDLSAANLGRSAAQGLLLGYGDEAIARVRAAMEGRPYEEVLAEERLKLEEFGERYPGTALATEFVGGAIPTAAAMMVPGGQLPGAARVAGMASRLPRALRGTTAKTATAGATTGAIAGSGTATEGNRMEGALGGGLTGMIMGPAFAKATDLGLAGGKNLYDIVRRSPQTVEDRAMSKVMQAMSRDEMDPAALKTQMAKDRAMGTDAMLMDVSPSMQTLGEAVVTMPGSGRKKLGEPLAERLEEGRERVGERVLQTIGKGVDFTKEEANLVGTLRANANTVYDKAYEFGAVNDPRIMRVLEDDTFKKAFNEAREIANKQARTAELRGEDPKKFALTNVYEVDTDGNIVKVNIPDVRTLDYIKRGIDALIDKGYKGAGMSSAEATALRDLKKEFVKVIDDNVPEYAAARAQYAGDIEVLDALRLGREKYLSAKMLPEQARQLVGEMSVAERDALRAGVAQSALDKIMNAPQQVNAAQRVIGAPATRKRLEVLFDDPAEFKLFEAALEREAELFRNAQEVIRNSRTANKKEAIEDLKKTDKLLDIAGEAVDLSTGGTGTVLGRVLRFMNKARGLDEKTAAELAELLKTKDVTEIDKIMSRLESRAANFEKQAKFREATQIGVGGATGSVLQQPRSIDTEEPIDEEEVDVDAIVERLTRGEN
jgi:hypothetical protein